MFPINVPATHGIKIRGVAGKIHSTAGRDANGADNIPSIFNPYPQN